MSGVVTIRVKQTLKAIQWTGGLDRLAEIREFLLETQPVGHYGPSGIRPRRHGVVNQHTEYEIFAQRRNRWVPVDLNDYIVRFMNGSYGVVVQADFDEDYDVIVEPITQDTVTTEIVEDPEQTNDLTSRLQALRDGAADYVVVPGQLDFPAEVAAGLDGIAIDPRPPSEWGTPPTGLPYNVPLPAMVAEQISEEIGSEGVSQLGKEGLLSAIQDAVGEPFYLLRQETQDTYVGMVYTELYGG